MKAVAVIPARFASTRFPGKPLAADTGQPLIQHVVQRAAGAKHIERVIVATDDQRIFDAVSAFGGEVVMTRSDHPSGTDRIAEVAATLDADLILNVQGDEPEIDPGHLDGLVELMAANPDAEVGTLACPFAVLAGSDPRDPNAVKVVLDARGHAIYFSRALIPHPRAFELGSPGLHQPAPYLLHVGVYAYRPAFLTSLAGLAPTALERTEQLEQLRWIEHGKRVVVRVVDSAAKGVDTPEDYQAFVERHKSSRAPKEAVGKIEAETQDLER
jgi:3-deoxy-manno-octulosonate cytidylyltransferase (CMP-KDO synthetase)